MPHKSTYRIIVADDHPIVMNGIKYLLHTHEAFTLVDVAYNGTDLLELLAEQSADTLLLDLNMPGYSYYNLLKQIL
ncbi:MAG: response regulator, partial [Bacteroidota bacterium]